MSYDSVYNLERIELMSPKDVLRVHFFKNVEYVSYILLDMSKSG